MHFPPTNSLLVHYRSTVISNNNVSICDKKGMGKFYMTMKDVIDVVQSRIKSSYTVLNNLPLSQIVSYSES